MTHMIEDDTLFGYVVGLSADWELVDQHFKSGKRRPYSVWNQLLLE